MVNGDHADALVLCGVVYQATNIPKLIARPVQYVKARIAIAIVSLAYQAKTGASMSIV